MSASPTSFPGSCSLYLSVITNQDPKPWKFNFFFCKKNHFSKNVERPPRLTSVFTRLSSVSVWVSAALKRTVGDSYSRHQQFFSVLTRTITLDKLLILLGSTISVFTLYNRLNRSLFDSVALRWWTNIQT